MRRTWKEKQKDAERSKLLDKLPTHLTALIEKNESHSFVFGPLYFIVHEKIRKAFYLQDSLTLMWCVETSCATKDIPKM